MCEYSRKLIAWLDRELPDGEMAAVERHLESCADCTARLNSYQQLSGSLVEFVDASSAAPRTPAPAAAKPMLQRLAPLALVAAAAAVAVVLFMPRPAPTPKQQPRTEAAQPSTSTLVVPAPPAVILAVRRSHVRKRPVSQPAVWMVPGPVVQIAIPADAVFPPGVLPEGTGFIGDLSLAADGSPGGLRLRP